MGKYIDLTGHRFGKLTVIRKLKERSSHGGVIWQCKCDCGNEKNVTTSSLKNGGTQSCGCIRSGKDITGHRFGKLIAIEKINNRTSSGGIIWRCKCDCGNEKVTSSAQLMSGNVKSCGCLAIKDLTGQRFGHLIAIKKTNNRSSGGGIIWQCKCDCGNEKNAVAGNLTSGNTQSCGCFNKNDKTGQRFGKLTVMKKTNKRSSHGAVIWQCKCDCGNEKNVATGHLINGSTKSCGCLLEKNNLKGQQIGRLFVIEKTNKLSSWGTVIWRCRCDCGNECDFSTGDLKGGHVRNCISCGNISSSKYKGKTYFRVSITKNNKTYRQWFDELSRALIVKEHVLSLYNKGVSNWNVKF